MNRVVVIGIVVVIVAVTAAIMFYKRESTLMPS
jgi:uncharacterized protein YxeA